MVNWNITASGKFTLYIKYVIVIFLFLKKLTKRCTFNYFTDNGDDDDDDDDDGDSVCVCVNGDEVVAQQPVQFKLILCSLY